MDSLPDMHDGFFDGLWISENKRAHLFLRTYTGERSTLILKDVECLNVSNFKAGNIVFDIVLVDSGKLTAEHIEQLYQFSDEKKAYQFLRKAQDRGLRGLEINPSYGAACCALFGGADMLRGHVLPQPAVPVSTQLL
jgi:hypothetical protein